MRLNFNFNLLCWIYQLKAYLSTNQHYERKEWFDQRVGNKEHTHGTGYHCGHSLLTASMWPDRYPHLPQPDGESSHPNLGHIGK